MGADSRFRRGMAWRKLGFPIPVFPSARRQRRRRWTVDSGQWIVDSG